MPHGDEAATQERFEEIVGNARTAAAEDLEGERSEPVRIDNGQQ